MIKEIAIDTFGGRDSMTDQALIENNQCASGSVGVWYNYGSLTKIPGNTIFLAVTASAATTLWADVYNDDITNLSNKLYHRISFPSSATATGAYYPWTGITDSLTPLGYTTGSISISGANLISATGLATLWATHASAGDSLNINTTSSAYYTIASVEDNTHLTLLSAVTTAVATGSSYTILPATGFIPHAVKTFSGFISWSTTGDVMQQYNGSGVLRVSAAPRAAFLEVHKDYLFAARTNTAQSRLYWSAVDNPTSWPTNNFIDIDKNNNGFIAGIATYGNELIIFKNRGMYRLIGSTFDPANPTYYVQPISVPPDFLFYSPYSVAQFTFTPTNYPFPLNKLVFFAHDAIYTYLAGTNYVSKITDKIRQDFIRPVNVTTDTMYPQQIRAYVIHNYYVLHGLPSNVGASGLQAFILDREGRFWFVAEATTASIFTTQAQTAIYNSSTLKTTIISPSDIIARQSRLYQIDFLGPTYATNTIEGTSGANVQINGSWYSKEFNIEYGTFKWVVIYLRKQTAGTLIFRYLIDQAPFVAFNIDMTVGRGNIIRAVIPIMQKGSTIQLVFVNNVAGQTFNVLGLKIYYEPSIMERER